MGYNTGRTKGRRKTVTEPIDPEKKNEEAPPIEEPVETPKADLSADLSAEASAEAEALAKAEAPAEVPPAAAESAEEQAADAPPVEAPQAQEPAIEPETVEAPKKKRKKREPQPEPPAETPAAEAPAADAPANETPAAEAPVAEAPATEAPAAETTEADAVAPAEGAIAPGGDAVAPAEGVLAPGTEDEAPKKKKREPKPEPPDFARRVEAILFATDQPVSARRIADSLDSTEARVKEIIAELREHYDADNRAFTVEEIAGGFQVLTRSDFGSIVKTLFEVERDHRLSQASLETLAIIAYKQPIIRAEIEDIRGVQVQPILKALQEQGLVRIVGRAEQLGRPMLYGTTQKFLMTFGLKSAKELPPVEELRKKQ